MTLSPDATASFFPSHYKTEVSTPCLHKFGYYICVPFAWLTRLFYSLTGSYGLALILFTLVVKLVILPFQLKSKKSMLRMNRMQGKVKDIQTRFANNRERQQQEMADLYAREGVNPMSGCLWSFIPFPILIALYAIIRTPLAVLHEPVHLRHRGDRHAGRYAGL